MRAVTTRAILVLLLLSSTGRADDTFVTLGAGGLVPEKSTQIVMESEDLQISVHRVTVRYVFRNITEHDVEGVIAFPLPDLDGGVFHGPINLPTKTQLNFVDFSVVGDGKPISTQIESRAFLDNQEVTARLRAAGLPVSVLLEPLNCALMKISPEKRKQLEREGLIVPDDFNPPLRCTGKEGWFATWTMRVRFYWTQRFPAKKSVTLTQIYKPVAGGSYIAASGDGSELVKPYCAGAEVLSEIERVKQQFHPLNSVVWWDVVWWERQINFILTTANNWSGPIRNFHLTVLSDNPDDITLTCSPRLKRVGATRYEFSQANFRPTCDLKLMILQANKGK
jgi:hypothetical protein